MARKMYLCKLIFTIAAKTIAQHTKTMQHNTLRKFIPLLIIALLASLPLASCGDKMKDVVTQAFLNGDTTAAKYGEICELIKGDARHYSNFVDDKGNINAQALDDYINQIGGNLRPPMHWNTLGYGQGAQALTLTIYFERSGSMVPYDTSDGGGQLKKSVNDLINHFPSQGGEASICIVNDSVYPYKGSIDQFLQDRDIYATTRGTGNASYTDFGLILDQILKSQGGNNVSVLVTDLIYSPRNTQGVSLEKIFNEENSIATSTFRRYHGKAVIVHQLSGDYHGKYYPYNGVPADYHGQRPYYLLVIADAAVIDRMAADPHYAQFLHPAGALNSYRFNQQQAQLEWTAIPGFAGNAGRFRPSRDQAGTLTSVEPDRTTGQLQFSVAVNLDALDKADSFVTDPANYQVQSMSGFTMAVRRIAQADISGNTQAYLEGKTHLLTFTGKLTQPKDEIKVTLRNSFPAWITAASSTNDTNVAAPGFATTTLGLDRFLRGIYDAFASDNAGNYGTLSIKLEK